MQKGKIKNGYEVLPHTADIGLRVNAKNMSQLFIYSAQGMISFLTDLKSVGFKKKLSFSLRSDSWESLLVQWLSEILYLFTVKQMALGKFKVKISKPFSLTATVAGEKINLKKHSVFREIKAATYHHLKIIKGPRGYRTELIFDL